MIVCKNCRFWLREYPPAPSEKHGECGVLRQASADWGYDIVVIRNPQPEKQRVIPVFTREDFGCNQWEGWR